MSRYTTAPVDDGDLSDSENLELVDEEKALNTQGHPMPQPQQLHQGLNLNKIGLFAAGFFALALLVAAVSGGGNAPTVPAVAQQPSKSYHEPVGKNSDAYGNDDSFDGSSDDDSDADDAKDTEEHESAVDKELDFEFGVGPDASSGGDATNPPTVSDADLLTEYNDIKDKAPKDKSAWFQPNIIKKETTWDKARIVLFTGLRHSGQHWVQDTLKTMCGGKDVKCIRLCATSNIKWATLSYGTYNTLLDDMAREFVQVRQQYESSVANGDSKVIFLANLWGDCPMERTVSFAFPYAEMQLDPAMFPDLPAIARVAEESQVDLRFVILHDDAPTQVVTRWLGNFRYSTYARTTFHVLRTAQLAYESMWGQVRTMDRQFFLPVNYESLRPFEGRSETLDDWIKLPGFTAGLEAAKLAIPHETGPKVNGTNLPGGKAHRNNITPRVADADDQEYYSRIEMAHTALFDFLSTGKSVPIVQKSPVNDDRPRILIFAGMEGTGHHLFTRIFASLIESHDNIEAHCPIQATLYRQMSRKSLWESLNSSGYVGAKQRLLKQLKELAADPNAKGKSFLVSLMDRHGTPCHDITGEMSYPNYGGPWKTFHHPDVADLARYAEEAGVDMQVVVLQRSGEKIIISTTVHRHFGKRRELRILEPVAYALGQQLQLIDPAFVAGCVDFGNRAQFWVPQLTESLRLGTTDMLKELHAILNAKSKHYTDKHKDERRRRLLSFEASNYAIREFCPNNP